MLELFLVTSCFHIGQDGLNEINPGIIAKDEHLVAGAYYNSFKRVSVLAGGYKQWEHNDWEYGLVYGGVTGYSEKWTVLGVTSFVAPYISYDFNGVKPTVLLLGNAVTFSVGYSF
ncbi:hypothetical protein [Listonella phage phiHSIC]|uniref:hypothetical protein n=1 Tax=Listonella phage phiHSIC TaxID=310539 RepID=UPI00004C73FD|nr:hypothetical protein LPPPVgp04 [Listonella phage phiHSIC]AAW67501.1 hypothetical protein [Listonella phage phiHSIC]